MSLQFDHDSRLTMLEEAIGYTFADQKWLVRAVTHRSYAHEADDADGNNQRMEFLGDSVLGLVIAEELFGRFEEVQEGALSGALSDLVCEPALVVIAQKLDLGRFMRLGRGEAKTGGREKPGLLSDGYEALLGAIFLDSGLDSARDVILRLHAEALSAIEPKPTPQDAKSVLQKFVQAKTNNTPEYVIVSERGPAHEKVFVAEVRVEGKPLARGEGRSKKDAERHAASLALPKLDPELT